MERMGRANFSVWAIKEGMIKAINRENPESSYTRKAFLSPDTTSGLGCEWVENHSDRQEANFPFQSFSLTETRATNTATPASRKHQWNGKSTNCHVDAFLCCEKTLHTGIRQFFPNLIFPSRRFFFLLLAWRGTKKKQIKSRTTENSTKSYTIVSRYKSMIYQPFIQNQFFYDSKSWEIADHYWVRCGHSIIKRLLGH